MPPSRSHRTPGWTGWVETESTKAGHCSLSGLTGSHISPCAKVMQGRALRIWGLLCHGRARLLALWILANAVIEVRSRMDIPNKGPQLVDELMRLHKVTFEGTSDCLVLAWYTTHSSGSSGAPWEATAKISKDLTIPCQVRGTKA